MTKPDQGSTAEQLRLVTEQYGAVLQDRDNLAREVDGLRHAMACSNRSAEHPNKPHGPAGVCRICYEALRTELARVSLVTGSIRSLVHVWMQSGRECPFCNKVTEHTKLCYLHGDAGDALLSEYAEIERTRDSLAALLAKKETESAPTNGHSVRSHSSLRADLTAHLRSRSSP